MSSYSDTTDTTDRSSTDMEEDDQGINDQVLQTNPCEQAFREAIAIVCFLGAEAARIRMNLHTLPINCVYERSFYTRQWHFVVHYHRLWCDELSRTSVEYLRAVMTIWTIQNCK